MDVDGDMEQDHRDFKNDDLKSNLKKLNLSSARKKQIDDVDDEDEKVLETAKEKIEKVTSPLKLGMKKKLKDSPSRIFDKLDVFVFYNHQKYSYSFQLITEAILEFADNSNLKDFIKNIVDNLISVTNPNEHPHGIISDNKHRKNNINMMDISGGSIGSIRAGRNYDKSALFNDIFFLQSKLSFI